MAIAPGKARTLYDESLVDSFHDDKTAGMAEGKTLSKIENAINTIKDSNCTIG